jgi:hypothetical protein
MELPPAYAPVYKNSVGHPDILGLGEESDIASLGVATGLQYAIVCLFQQRCRGGLEEPEQNSSTATQGGLMHGIQGRQGCGWAWGKSQGFSIIRTLNRDNPVIWPPFRPRSAHKVILFHRLWGKCEGRDVSRGSVQRGRHVDRNCEYQLPVLPVAHRSMVYL